MSPYDVARLLKDNSVHYIVYCRVTVFLSMSCIVHIAIVIWCHALISVGNVFRSGSSSEGHHSKRTASSAPQQRLHFHAAKVTRH
jgi:hypothetical protein